VGGVKRTLHPSLGGCNQSVLKGDGLPRMGERTSGQNWLAVGRGWRIIVNEGACWCLYHIVAAFRGRGTIGEVRVSLKERRGWVEELILKGVKLRSVWWVGCLYGGWYGGVVKESRRLRDRAKERGGMDESSRKRLTGRERV